MPDKPVIVAADGQVIGEGTYRYDGVTHAEVIALEAAGERSRGSTAYVSLEPHAHHGRTPPCTDALINAGVSRVVCPIEDPNPAVSGLGFERLKAAGIVVSLFIEPSVRQLDAAVALGAPVVELHTGKYCDMSGAARGAELQRLVEAAQHGSRAGLRINAGHGLNYENLPAFLAAVPHLDTLNIGHSIVARAVLVGMERAVREMKSLLA